MVSVAEAEAIILKQTKEFGCELVSFEQATGRVLAENILADRDIPSCNKSTMDGIAISAAAFTKGIRSFTITATIAAGDAPIATVNETECVEIMTGAAVPGTLDTVVRYEDVRIASGVATVEITTIRQGQNIHRRGKDKLQGDIVASSDQPVDAAIISMAASSGKEMLSVRNLPKTLIITTGDEIVAISEQPSPYQVRSSNNYTIKAVLRQYGIVCDMLHIKDNPQIMKEQFNKCLAAYDVIIMTGGVSMGKFDYVPQAMDDLGVNKLFHKVMQKPGKPFWFGKHNGGALVFAFPGNPVSTFLCLHRYFVPWLEACLKLNNSPTRPFAILAEDVTFAAPLQYFMQVQVGVDSIGQLIAKPIEGNGSGDFANLVTSNAFMELPAEKSTFSKGEAYRIWPFKQIV
jgi:molybdopterin molybdotransferase